MAAGKILFLNGLTSSGKSSTADFLREMADDVVYVLSNDTFHEMISWRFFRADFWDMVAHTIAAEYSAARGMAEAGFTVLIDGMLLDLDGYRKFFGKSNAELLTDTFRGLPLTTVDLVCPLDELRRRNRIRGNRGVNQSDEQNAFLTRGFSYDLTLDAMRLFPDECAEAILQHTELSFTPLSWERTEKARIKYLTDLLTGFGAAVSSDGSAYTVTAEHTEDVSAIAKVLREHGYLDTDDPSVLVRGPGCRIRETLRVCAENRISSSI